MHHRPSFADNVGRRVIVGAVVLLATGVGASAWAGADASSCDGNPVRVFTQPPPGFDSATATDAQLAQYGLPPRPPGAAPGSPAYLAWLTAVENASSYSPPDPTCGTGRHAASDRGTLVGGIVYTGTRSQARYQPGVVQVTHDHHVVAHRKVGRNHLYRFRLAPGTYGIVGHTKRGNCTGSARVRAGHTTHANAYCVFH